MSARRGLAIASIALVPAVASAFATADRAETAPAQSPRGVVENCSTIRGVEAAREFVRPRNLLVGPLAILRANGIFARALLPHADSVGEAGEKLFVLVRGGHRVTLELTRSTRRDAGLAFGPYPDGEVRLRDARRMVTFVACRRGEAERTSPPYGWPISGWVGFLIVRSPRCVPIRIWVDDEPRPRHAAIRFAVRECG
jgi:hypothetical protein